MAVTPAGAEVTQAESDAKYSAAGSAYSKAEIDAKFAPFVNSVAASAGGDQFVELTSAEQVMRQVSLMPPANGTVIVSSSATLWTHNPGITRCSVNSAPSIDYDFLQFRNSFTAVENDPISGTRGFPVTKGTLFTAYLVCDEASGNASITDSSLTAIFAPS